MNDHDRAIVDAAGERFERRLAEECGALRVDMATEFGRVRAEMAAESGRLRADMAAESGRIRADMATESGRLRTEMAAGFGALRSEMIDRNPELLKWILGFLVLQLAAMTGLFALFR